MDWKPLRRDDILMGRETEFPLDASLEKNLFALLNRINLFGKLYWVKTIKNLEVNSGYRPGYYNLKAHGALNSAHLYCMAVDLHDMDGDICDYLEANVALLEEIDMYWENPKSTPTWIHLDIRKRGHRIFNV